MTKDQKAVLAVTFAWGLSQVSLFFANKEIKHLNTLIGRWETVADELVDFVDIGEAQSNYLRDLINREGVPLTDFDLIALKQLKIEVVENESD